MAFIAKQGALLPTYVVELRELIGTPNERQVPNLDQAVGFKFLMRAEGAAVESEPLIFGDAAYWQDPDNPATYTASVEYIWQDGDLDVAPGNFQGEVWTEWVAGKFEKFPNEGYFAIKINPDLQVTVIA